MKYFFETYGCQMNHAESAGIEQILISRGWQAAEQAEEADLLLINTCSVRITAETRVFGRLAHYGALKKKHHFRILLMGCMAERLHHILQKRFPQLDYVVGMYERHCFNDIAEEVETLKDFKLKIPDVFENEFLSRGINEVPASSSNAYYFSNSSYKEGAFQSYVPIMNGCNNYCTFCIVPYVRGPEVSRNMEDILAEVDILAEKGVKEITLLGQNVNSYKGKDSDGNNIDFPELLRRVAKKCDEKDIIKWIRFVSSHPKDMSDRLIEVIAEEPRVCKLVHLPIQHGSNVVLKRMNRRYTREHYLGLVEKLKTQVKGLALSTDILIGFPGETEEELQETLSLMGEVEFDAAFMYHYNPREGTRAFAFPNRIPDSLKIQRLQRVIDLQLKTTEKKMLGKVGSETTVLLESHSRNNPDELFGHTEYGEMVVLEGKVPPEFIGNFVEVRINSLKGKTFRAMML